MNKIYKLIWSKAKNCWVVASELAKGHGKNKSRAKNSLLAVAVMSALLAGGVADVQALTQQEKEEVAKYLLDKIAHGGEIPGVDATRGPTNFPDAIANRIFYYNDISNKIGEKLKKDGLTLRYFSVRPSYLEPDRNDLNRYADPAWTNVNNDGAFGKHAMALGYRAFSEADHGVAFGRSSLAGGYKRDGGYGGDGDVAIGNMAWALGDKAVSIGDKALSADKSIAIGIQAEAGANKKDSNSIQYDPQTKLPYVVSDIAKMNSAIAIGRDAKAWGHQSVSIGGSAKATGKYALSFGNSAEASAMDSFAFGNYASAKGIGAIAIGSNYDRPSDAAKAYSTDTIVIGRGAKAGNEDDTEIAYNTVAIGKNAKAVRVYTGKNINDAVLIGANTQVTRERGIAVGADAYVDGVSGAAFGDNASVIADEGLAIGKNAKIAYNSTQSIAIGSGAEVKNENAKPSERAVAVGTGAVVGGKSSDAIAIGTGAKTQEGAQRSIVIGKGAVVKSYDSVVIGTNASAQWYNAVAIGNGAQATLSDGIALGSDSKTTVSSGYKGYDPYKNAFNIDAHPGAAWESTKAALSVGDVENNITRQITSVAAGRNDTDAVNVAQLKKLRDYTDTKMSSWVLKASSDKGAAANGQKINNTDNAVTFDVENATQGLKVTRDGATIKYGVDRVKLANYITGSVIENINGGGIPIINIAAKFGVTDGTNTKAVNLGRGQNNNVTFQGKDGETVVTVGGANDAPTVTVGLAEAFKQKIENGAMHYFSVDSKEPADPAGTNWNNDGAKGIGSMAIGSFANAVSRLGLATAVGSRTAAAGQGANAYGGGTAAGEGTVAIGQNAVAASKPGITKEEYDALREYNQKFYISGNNGLYYQYQHQDGKRINDEKNYNIAIGSGTESYANQTVSLGYKAKSDVDGGVAIGAESSANRQAGGVGYIATGSSATFEDALTTLHKKEDYDKWTAIVDASKKEYDKLTRSFDIARTKERKDEAKAALDAWKEKHADFVEALAAKEKLEATWKGTKGAVSVGKDEINEAGNRVIASRQITNVAAGTEDTDAVNVAQLKALNTKVDNLPSIHYFSVKADDSKKPADTNWNNDGATGNKAIAIGQKAKSEGYAAVAMGASAHTGANAHYSLALGMKSDAAGFANIALGNEAKAQAAMYATAIGQEAAVTKSQGIAIGTTAKTDAENGISFGTQAKSLANRGIAVGTNSTVDETGGRGIAIGDGSYVGAKTQDHSGEGMPNPGDAWNPSEPYLPVADDTVAGPGKLARENSMAIGMKASAFGFQTTALGAAAEAHDTNTTAVGAAAVAKGNYSTALGKQARTFEKESTSVGHWADSRAEFATALGSNTIVYKKGGVALGFGARAYDESSIAIGSNSIAKEAIDGKAYLSDEEVKAAAGIVSVGNPAYKVGDKDFAANYRRIVNVAGGIHDNDAVNVMQLKALETKVTANADNITKGWVLKATSDTGEEEKGKTINNTDNEVTFDVEKDQGLTVKREGATIKYGVDNAQLVKNINDGDTAITNISANFSISGAAGADKKELTLGKASAPNIQFLGTTGETTVTVGGTDTAPTVKVGLDEAFKKKVKANTDNIASNTEKIETLTGRVDTAEKTIKSNTDRIDTAEKTIKSNTDRIDTAEKTIKSNTDRIDTAEKTIKSNTDRIDTAEKTIKSNTEAIEQNKKDIAAKMTSWKLKAEGVDGEAEITNEGTVTFDVKEANKGLTVERKGSTIKYGIDGSKIDIKENDTVKKLEKDIENSKTTVKAGNENISVVKANDKNEYTITLAEDLKGLKSISSETVNATTVNASEKVTVGGNVTINNDGLTIKEGPSVTTNGIDAGKKKITNVVAGDVSEKSTEAVNGGQLFGVEQKVNINSRNISILGGKVSELNTRVNRVGAGAAALAALHPLDFDPDDKWDFAAGYGNYKGANAAAIGAYYRPNEDTMVSVGGSFGGGENMVNAGVSVKLGQGNHVTTSRVAMAKEIKDLRAEVEVLRQAVTGIGQGQTPDPVKMKLFPDIAKNHWAYEAVEELTKQGLLEGYPDGTFGGDRMMTRYEFAEIVYRAMQKGLNVNEKLIQEFEPELERFRIDVISKDKDGNPVIERVRVNEKKKAK